MILFAPAPSSIRPGHSAALGAGSELVVLVFEQDLERGEGYSGQKLSTVRSSAPFEYQIACSRMERRSERERMSQSLRSLDLTLLIPA